MYNRRRPCRVPSRDTCRHEPLEPRRMLAADLIATDLSVSSGTVHRGEDVAVTVNFTNAGDADAPFFRLNVFLSPNDVIGDDDDILLTQIRRVSGLAAGLSDSSVREVELGEDVAAGTYFVGFVLDVEGAVEESSEDNNSIVSAPGALVVTEDDSDDDDDDDDTPGDDDSPSDDDTPDDDGDDDDTPGGDDDHDDDGTEDGDDSADDSDDDEDISVSGRGDDISDDDDRPSFSDGTAFGRVVEDSEGRVRTFTVRNDGAGDLEIFDIRIEGRNPGSFSIVGAPSDVIGAGEEFELEIRFEPGSPGMKRATIIIETDDLDEDSFNFRVSGKGLPSERSEISLVGLLPIEDGDDSPGRSDGTAMGTRTLGASRDRTFTITNLGDADLNLNTLIQIGGRNPIHFTVIDAPDEVVAPGQSTTFTIRFSPESRGMKKATVTVFSDDADEGEFSFDIRGLGRAS